MNIDILPLAVTACIGAVCGYLAGYLRSRLHLKRLRERITHLLGKCLPDHQIQQGTVEWNDRQLAEGIARLVQRCEDQREKEYLLEKIVEFSPMGILLLSSGKIRLINSTLISLLKAPGTVRSWAERDALELFRIVPVHNAIEKASKGDEMSGPIMVDWHERIFRIHITALNLDSPDILLIWEDVTTCVRSQEAAQDLIAKLAHELRTPLTSIKGYAETLLENSVNEGNLRQKFLRVILKNADRLSNLARDVLLLARIEATAGKGLERKRVDMEQLLSQAIDWASPMAEERGIKIIKKVLAMPVYVIGSPQDLEQALFNLLDNAIKYTVPDSEIHTGIKQQGDNILVYVKDQGRGIPKDAQEKIFDRFYRIDRDHSRKIGGTGLGLAIVKQVAKEHGGRVWVESTWGKGACFYMAIPTE